VFAPFLQGSKFAVENKIIKFHLKILPTMFYVIVISMLIAFIDYSRKQKRQKWDSKSERGRKTV